jgi:hypothetical protein
MLSFYYLFFICIFITGEEEPSLTEENISEDNNYIGTNEKKPRDKKDDNIEIVYYKDEDFNKTDYNFKRISFLPIVVVFIPLSSGVISIKSLDLLDKFVGFGINHCYGGIYIECFSLPSNGVRESIGVKNANLLLTHINNKFKNHVTGVVFPQVKIRQIKNSVVTDFFMENEGLILMLVPDKS